ncbi:MAG TPA: hypothetical protein VFQ88_09465 [Nevskiaceae bacterium]|nr:hypothetical protein [Nevskiaceae bacterium]
MNLPCSPRTAALTALLGVCLACRAPAALAGASGTVETRPNPCGAGSTAVCSTIINARLNIDDVAIGHVGAIFVVVLPTNAKGVPLTTKGAYATRAGWSVGIQPAAYYTGPLPILYTIQTAIPGGICARAAKYTQAHRFSVFAGYGVAPTSGPGALHVDPNLPASAMAPLRTAAAAAAMVRAHTVWRIGGITCG